MSSPGGRVTGLAAGAFWTVYGARISRTLRALLALASLTGAAPVEPLIPRPDATVIASPCPNGSGTACAYRATATIYAPPTSSRFAVEHERGHLFDEQYLNDGERAKLRRLIGLPAGPWRAGTGLEGLRSPSERFADAYAACRLRLSPDGLWETGYDYQPSAERHRAVCGTIARAADRDRF